MLKTTRCSVCLSLNKRTINIYGTDLQNVYEKLAEFKAKAELCFLCYICHARLQQVANLQNIVTSSSQLPKTLVHLTTQNIENETVQDHVVLVKQESLEFEDVQERHMEHDDVSIKDKIENSEYIDKIEIIENSIDYKVNEEKTINVYANAKVETVQDSQVVDSIYTQQDQYVRQSPTTHLVLEDLKDWGGQPRGKDLMMFYFCTPAWKSQLPKTLVHLTTQNIENETVQDHVVLAKQEPLEFEDVQDRHMEHDDVPIKAEIESRECRKHEDERPNTDDCEGRGHASAAQSSKTPHTCDICLKNYSTRRQLLRHMKTHTAELPFSCDTCSKNFSSKQVLIAHMSVHTGEKPFSCDICSKKFSHVAVI
ncbi:zinc finger protein 268-like isoform X4 [Aricia agestis]|uniref:zinc finger protein 268-like isoform X4 n=1 Tax=Aricia agestis TaxID=91739 RepID=UPI001C205910|nr:zinc finger protein 268-like isoform X4 [Aricia agestis]